MTATAQDSLTSLCSAMTPARMTRRCARCPSWIGTVAATTFPRWRTSHVPHCHCEVPTMSHPIFSARRCWRRRRLPRTAGIQPPRRERTTISASQMPINPGYEAVPGRNRADHTSSQRVRRSMQDIGHRRWMYAAIGTNSMVALHNVNEISTALPPLQCLISSRAEPKKTTASPRPCRARRLPNAADTRCRETICRRGFGVFIHCPPDRRQPREIRSVAWWTRPQQERMNPTANGEWQLAMVSASGNQVLRYSGPSTSFWAPRRSGSAGYQGSLPASHTR